MRRVSCNSQPHQLSGLYALGSTCSSKSGQGYASSYDGFGNVNSRTFSGTTGTLSYDNFNRLTEWNVGSTNQEWYVYDAAGTRVLRRFTNSSSTTMIVYAFGLEEHNYSGAGAHQNDTFWPKLSSRASSRNPLCKTAFSRAKESHPTVVVFVTPRPTKLNGLSEELSLLPGFGRSTRPLSPDSLLCGMLLTERK